MSARFQKTWNYHSNLSKNSLKEAESVAKKLSFEKQRRYGIKERFKRIQRIIPGTGKKLKRVNAFSELADYYMEMRYLLDFVDNGKSEETNHMMGVEMLWSLREIENRYAVSLILCLEGAKTHNMWASRTVSDISELICYNNVWSIIKHNQKELMAKEKKIRNWVKKTKRDCASLHLQWLEESFWSKTGI